jgi:uncharacterized protein (TIGR02117 family)
LKKKKKIICKSLLFFFELIVLYSVAVFIFPLITIDKETLTTEDVEIHILTNGVHTDIVVPVLNNQMDWRTQIKYAGVANDSYKYLAMGWGDKGFYLDTPTWAELKASTAFNAAFGFNTTAIHTTFYKNMTVGESCKKMMISTSQYLRLITYIKGSFKTNNNGNFMLVDTDVTYGTTDAFYEAKGTYHLFQTCNTWANNALYACGQKCCYWTPIDIGIFSKY